MPTTIAEARSLFREYTNERSTTVLPDATVDIYIQSGLEALNRRVRYHYSDSTSGITLVAGTQEYDLPSDLVELKWVEWNGLDLDKGSIEQWRRKAIRWRQHPAGSPKEWAFYRDRIVFLPKPDAAAVALAANPVLRYVSRPGSFTSVGMEQLNIQDWSLPVYWAVTEWCAAYPDSAVAMQKRVWFRELFDSESAAVLQYYGLREVER